MNSNRTAKIGAPEPIAALNRVKIREAALPWKQRERLVDVRIACPDIVWAEGICPYLRESVAARLNEAHRRLPPGYQFKAGTALRTLSMQKGGWDGYFNRMRDEHPTWPLSALRRATNKFFAPYDQPAPPGHCTGGAVDVGLIDPEGNSLDMSSPTKGWDGAYTWSDKITPESKANRMLMVEAMLGAGFSNCRDEFWHYSWGDSAWAVRVGKPECPFDWIHPAVALETDFPEARASGGEIETARNFHGRVVGARGAVSFQRDEALLTIGIYWAKAVPVSLTVQLPHGLTETPTLYLGDGKETWEIVSTWERRDDRIFVELSPDHDRAVLTTHPPLNQEAKVNSFFEALGKMRQTS